MAVLISEFASCKKNHYYLDGSPGSRNGGTLFVNRVIGINPLSIWDIERSILLQTYSNAEPCILYSGLLHNIDKDILVFAGTVFSHVNIYACKHAKPLQVLQGHKGVIFSILWHSGNEIIVTTSDDRSVRIWGPNSKTDVCPNKLEYWTRFTMVSKRVMYGHLARIPKACLSDNSIITIGEDSLICIWDINGELIRKLKSHQDAPIWSVDSDPSSNLMVTGGGDSGLILQPLSVKDDTIEKSILEYESAFGNPKKIFFSARNNIICLTDSDNLMYYIFNERSWVFICKMSSTNKYKVGEMSPCRQLLALVDMDGNLSIFAESCKNEAIFKLIVDSKINSSTISLNWADNRHIVTCSKVGLISVYTSQGKNCVKVAEFNLPKCKEPWLTSAVFMNGLKNLIVGDRCGNMHLFSLVNKEPLHTVFKVHGNLGIHTITIDGNQVQTTGRDGAIKFFEVQNKADGTKYLNFLYRKTLPFEWVERFIDRSKTLICGFKERNFIIYDVATRMFLMDIFCGGGHRSWDVIKLWLKEKENNVSEIIHFVYTKNNLLHHVSIQMKDIKAFQLLPGWHASEVNCLHMIHTKGASDSKVIIISGGEDTTVRVSTMNLERPDQSFENIFVLKQLSSIRTICIYDMHDESKYLVICAGGRAQICIRYLEFNWLEEKLNLKIKEVADYMLKGSDKDRMGKKSWRDVSIDINPETRIMTLDAVAIVDSIAKYSFIVLAGCSDSDLRVYRLKVYESSNVELELISTIKFHKTCILQVHCFKKSEYLCGISMTTNGEVAFWNLQHFLDHSDKKIHPCFYKKLNKSGINCFDVLHLSADTFILATGGEDNTIYLTKIKILPDKDANFCLVNETTWSGSNFHSSQITGLNFIDEKYLLSVSKDQRLTLCEYQIDEMKCTFIKQFYTDVSDVQGMSTRLIDSAVTVCVYGKGMEVLSLELPKEKSHNCHESTIKV